MLDYHDIVVKNGLTLSGETGGLYRRQRSKKIKGFIAR